ncbi:hypothetical protein [Prevotella jejuni]|jgi:hypothetical protein|uniref:hypothetical protein n=1 Tax=Prevotella jejuni TaxID=1177574 RepID=UPI001C5D9830|nr:hypothetical protein [Prevotella jejuni]MBW4771989.1 hypothetical protein [Prevotella jejuni]
MNKQKELVRNVYIKPECNLLNTYTETLMVNASGNAGGINPGEGAGDAKKAFFWDDEDVASVSQNWGE